MSADVRCAECGHRMYQMAPGRFSCAENTCSIGLAVLGDFRSAERVRARRDRDRIERPRPPAPARLVIAAPERPAPPAPPRPTRASDLAEGAPPAPRRSIVGGGSRPVR